MTIPLTSIQPACNSLGTLQPLKEHLWLNTQSREFKHLLLLRTLSFQIGLSQVQPMNGRSSGSGSTRLLCCPLRAFPMFTSSSSDMSGWLKSLSCLLPFQSWRTSPLLWMPRLISINWMFSRPSTCIELHAACFVLMRTLKILLLMALSNVPLSKNRSGKHVNQSFINLLVSIKVKGSPLTFATWYSAGTMLLLAIMPCLLEFSYGTTSSSISYHDFVKILLPRVFKTIAHQFSISANLLLKPQTRSPVSSS